MTNEITSSEQARLGLLGRVGDLVAALVGAILAALVALIVVAIFAQVFWRYVLNDPLLWPEEVARYSFIWLAFLGLPLLLRQRELIAVNALVDRLPAALCARLPLLVGLLGTPLLAVLVWQGIVMIGVVAGQVAPATGLPAGWLYLAAPVGGALSLFYFLESLVTPRPATGSGARSS